MVTDTALTPITLHAVRGDTKSWIFTVDWDSVVDPQDLESCRFTVKQRSSDADADLILQLDSGSGVTVGADTITVDLDATAADALGVITRGVWDIEARTTTQIRTVALGTIVVQRDAAVDAPTP